jgi:hypothetical protein
MQEFDVPSYKQQTYRAAVNALNKQQWKANKKWVFQLPFGSCVSSV